MKILTAANAEISGNSCQTNFTALPELQGRFKLSFWDKCRSVDLYQLFTENETANSIKLETIRKADHRLTRIKIYIYVSQRSKINKWKPVILSELTNFLVITAYKKVVQKHSCLLNNCLFKSTVCRTENDSLCFLKSTLSELR